ncbi:MAG: hypothetical protein ABW250_04495 [Pyrinomonadaceae bacterium]
MRTFIHYDGGGKVIAATRVETLPEGFESPFMLMDETHGVLELPDDHPMAKEEDLLKIYEGYAVDTAQRRLVNRS